MIGPEPNDVSTEPLATGARQHLDAAREEERRIQAHRELYKPRARIAIRLCAPEVGEEGSAPECWIENINPTAIHDAEMRAHSDLAAYHRKAARDLRTAEASACQGIAKEHRSRNPFAGVHVLGVSPLEERLQGTKDSQLQGAIVFLQPVTDLTVNELQRSMDCYAAHQAMVGYGLITTESTRSPLSEPGAQAGVTEHGHSFVVKIRAEDPAAAQAVWLRAQRLAVVD